MNQYWHIIVTYNPHLLRFPQFPPNDLSSLAGYSARLVVTAPSFLRRSSFWRTLTCARSPGQIFRSQFLSWNLPVVSLTIRPKLGGFRRKTTQVTCRSHHVRSKARTVTWFATADVHFNPLVEEVFVRLLLCEVTHFPPFFSFQKVLCRAHS